MTVLLEIDYREREIIERLQQKEQVFNAMNLPIGDFVIRNQVGEIYFIIERKSIKDLCASIIDSRFREQKNRLLASIDDPVKIIYILEGSKVTGTVGKGKLSKNIIDSAIMNLVLKHQYKVLFSDSLDDTVDQIMLLYKKVVSGDLTSQPKQAKLVKKSDALNVLVNQLCVIPGVSLTTANKLNERYSCMEELLLDLKEPEYLSNIQLGKRKLGKALSIKIFNALKKSETNIQ